MVRRLAIFGFALYTLAATAAFGQAFEGSAPPTLRVTDSSRQSNPSSASAATSNDPQIRAHVLELFDAMRLQDRMRDMAHTLFQSLRPMLEQSIPLTPRREAIVQSLVDKFSGLLTSKETINDLADIYAKHLSDDDVQAATKFYQSAAGQHFNDAAPQLTVEGSELGQKLMLQHLPEIFKDLCMGYPELKESANFCAKDAPDKKGH